MGKQASSSTGQPPLSTSTSLSVRTGGAGQALGRPRAASLSQTPNSLITSIQGAASSNRRWGLGRLGPLRSGQSGRTRSRSPGLDRPCTALHADPGPAPTAPTAPTPTGRVLPGKLGTRVAAKPGPAYHHQRGGFPRDVVNYGRREKLNQN